MENWTKKCSCGQLCILVNPTQEQVRTLEPEKIRILIDLMDEFWRHDKKHGFEGIKPRGWRGWFKRTPPIQTAQNDVWEEGYAKYPWIYNNNPDWRKA